MLIMTFPPFAPNAPNVIGTVTKLGNGDLIVDGSTYTIDRNGPYVQEGNITVTGANGKLIIRDTVVNILTPEYKRNIKVMNGAQLILDNSTITVNLDTFNFTEELNIEITNNGVLDMENSNLECNGDLKANNGRIYIRNSTIAKNSNTNGLFDTCVDINLSGSSYMLVYNSYIKDLPEYNIPEGIAVSDNSMFVAINTFLDIDFEDTDYSRLKLTDSAKAYLYGVTTVNPTSYPPDASAISVLGQNARVEIYKWADLNVIDGAGIPVGGVGVTVQNFTQSTPVGAPRKEILGYIGKTDETWNMSGIDGAVFFPLRTNILRYGATFPVNNYTGTYNLTGRLAGFSHVANGGLSFSTYPRMKAEDNMISTNLSYTDVVVPPMLNKHYSDLNTPLKVTGTKTFNSPIQLQQNLVIDGGTLTIDSSELKFAQNNDNRFYIIVMNEGVLNIINSELMDMGNIKFNIYNYGSMVNIDSSELDDVGVLVTRDGGKVSMMESRLNGNFNVMSYQTNVSITDNSVLNGTDMVLDHANVMLMNAVINATGKLSTDDLTLSAVNTSFSKGLVFNGNTEAELIDVTIKKKTAPITVTESAVVSRGWWLTVNVTDGGGNPVSGAVVNAYNYSLPSGDLIMYRNGTTNSKGQAIVKVIGEITDATNTYKGLERSYVINATYSGLITASTGFTSPTANVKKFLSFTEKPDLKAKKIEFIGDKIEGKTIKLKAEISNEGTFEARDVVVRFMLDDKQIGSDQVISLIGVGGTETAMVSWDATLGTYDLTVQADPDYKIGEMTDSNNNITTELKIEVGAPDIFIQGTNINFNPAAPTIEQLINISVAVGNSGGTDPIEFGNTVTVDIYLGDPDTGGIKLGNSTILTSIPPNQFAYAYAEYTFDTTGDYTIYARATTGLDSKLTNNQAFADLEVLNFADLTINAPYITFKPGSEVAQGTTVTIDAEIMNLGESNAYNVQVEFYDGNPSSGGLLIGTKTANVVVGNSGSANVQYSYKVSSTGLHNIYVVVDRLNTTRELDETNNMANNTLRVLKEPDLITDSISVFSSIPGHVMEDETVTIESNIKNIGETPTGEFDVYIFFKSTNNLIGKETISDLAAGSNVTVQVTWTPDGIGTNNLIVWSDFGQAVTETNEENNQKLYEIRVYKKPDLTMDLEDIRTNVKTTPPEVSYASEVIFNVTIRNRGESDASSFWVQFFDGNPKDNGIQIDINKRVSGIKAGKTRTVEVKWDAMPSGYHTIYILIDAFNEIMEASEGNNSMTYNIYVETVPDLEITSKDITVSGGDYGRIDESVNIKVNIKNKGDTASDPFAVKFYLGDPAHDDNPKLIQTVDLESGIAGGGTGEAMISWTPTEFGVHKIFVWVDADQEITEINDENNIAGLIFEVLEIAPDLSINENDIRIIKIEDGSVVSNVQTGVAYGFNITIRNVGNENITIFDVSVTYKDPLNRDFNLGTANHRVMGVAAGESTTLQINWKPLNDGSYTFTVNLDSTQLVREFSEENNSASKTFNVKTKPNFYIADKRTDIDMSTDSLAQGEDISFEVVLSISGNADDISTISYDFTVDGVPVEGISGSTTVNKETDPPTATIKFTWTTHVSGQPPLVLVIDPNGDIDESDEDDNNIELPRALISGQAAGANGKEGKSSFMLILIILIIVIVVVAVVAVVVVKKKKGKKTELECQECGTKVEPGVTECPECGAEIIPPPEVVECANCGAEITTADENCPECDEKNEAYVPSEKDGGEGGRVPPDTGAATPAAAAAAPTPQPVPAPKQSKSKKSKKKKPEAAGPTPVPAPQVQPMGAPEMPMGGDVEMTEFEGMDDIMADEGEGEAECYSCGARVPLSVPKCPVCGADFE